MRYRKDQYQAYIRALTRRKNRGAKRAAWGALACVTLLAVYFGVQLKPDASQVISPLPPEAMSPMAQVEGPLEGKPESPPAEFPNPGARGPWDQKFGDLLKTEAVTVSPGDTLGRILRRAGIANEEAYEIIQTLKKEFDPAKLRQGHTIYLDFINSEPYPPFFQRLRLRLGPRKEIQLIKDMDSGYTVRQTMRELSSRHSQAAATIRSSLYQAARSAGIPMEVFLQVLRAYAYDVDFQRDIQPGDRIEVLYEEKMDADGRFIQAGPVLYASLRTCGRNLRVYRHHARGDEIPRLFDEDGKSIQKALMLTPIDGARLSSGYGMRRHPILGYNKMHKGLDFAAPTGTPIMAAGDGIVEYSGRRGSYGNYIRIRHPDMYQTIYGHMSGYADGMKSGVRVKQGEVIGYVGSTGRSTGPHLHFEVRHGGKPVNPAAIKTPPGRALEGEELARFLLAKNRLEALYASLTEEGKKLAAAGPKKADAAVASQ
jgi:murein DD-endopeptidase MepM/ murein hydrolase activator NlpD